MVRTTRSKYGNKKVKADGYTFDSLKEWRRYKELKLLVAADKICSLTVHERWPLCVKTQIICTYVADFSYDVVGPGRTLRRVVEDVKGVKTAVYRIKKKLMKAIYNVDIQET